MALGGALLRFGQTGLRILEFGCAAIVLGIYSYYLAVLSRNHTQIPTWERAVEGMSGAAVLYTLFGILLTLFLGGIAVFGFIAVFLDLCFVGCFAAIAYYTRDGANNCKGTVNTPVGSGPNNADAPGAGNYGYACSLNTACFAVSILAVFLFFITAIFQVLLVKHHKKEKRYGPSPSNNYTTGAGRRPFWKRNKKVHNTRDAELATAGTGVGRHSHETGMTGNTMHDTGYAPASTEPKYGQPGYGQTHYGGETTHHHTTTATNY